MKLYWSRSRVLIVLRLVLFLLLIGCVASENSVVTEFRKLEHSKSTLIHTETFPTSSATGECSGRANDWWYGTEETGDELIRDFIKQLSRNGWDIWSSDQDKVWRKETDRGLFTFSLYVFNSVEQINPNRAFYNLSDAVLHEMSRYETIYVATLSHMSPADTVRCLTVPGKSRHSPPRDDSAFFLGQI